MTIRMMGVLRKLTFPCLGLCGALFFGSGCGSTPIPTLGLNIIGTDEVVPPGEDPPPPEHGETEPVGGTAVNEYCEATLGWESEWVEFEDEVLALVNERRASGADCGGAGTFDAAGPLSMHNALRCAARNHSMDMATRGYFDHTTPEGQGPGARLDQAGYDGSTWGENIAWGYPTPSAVVDGWMTSPGHCANIMNPQFTQTGIGYCEGSEWTQTFGRP